MKKIGDTRLKDAHVLLHPIRFRIAELLAEKPMQISELSTAMGGERRLVSYHLLTLEKYGFVSSSYEMAENPKSKRRAIRKYQVTSKVEEVLAELKKI
jgi:DNA-binding transcriptional ArsR family regulator